MRRACAGYLLREVRKGSGRPALAKPVDRLRQLEPITTEQHTALIERV